MDWINRRFPARSAILLTALLNVLPVSAADLDNDNISDSYDNCLNLKNAQQADADRDGLGGACDGDFNNDGLVNFADLSVLKRDYATAAVVPDLTADGDVSMADLALIKPQFFGPAGSSSDAAKALANGSVAVSNADDLLQAALDIISDGANLHERARIQLFNLNEDGSASGDSLTAVSWNPTHDTAFFRGSFGLNRGLLRTNNVTLSGYTIYERDIVQVGLKHGTRYMAMGSNPMRTSYRDFAINEQMHQFLENSLSWLMGRENGQSAFKVVLGDLPQSYYFPDEVAVRSWLDTRYGAGTVNYNAAKSCDREALLGCLQGGADLLILSQDVDDPMLNSETGVAAVEYALKHGIPVLYVHHDGGLSAPQKAVTEYLDLYYEWDNYWKKLQVSAFDPSILQAEVPPTVLPVQTMLQHFKNSDYNFDWSVCWEAQGREHCEDVAGLQSEFLAGATAVKSIMNSLDNNNRNIFKQAGMSFEKSLALLGDAYRQEIVYPLQRGVTNDTTFMRAFYADHAVYNSREVNPVQADLGTFSRTDFSSAITTSVTRDFISRASFRAAGVYALPGQTVRVTRLDNSDVAVGVFVNTQNAGSTHVYANPAKDDDHSYARPRFLRSANISIAPGQTIYFTSPYGGPVQVSFGANDQNVSLKFDNVGEHAYWASPDDDASFTAKLAANEFDWAELSTPGFEVHSRLSRMNGSVALWGSAQNLAEKTLAHMYNYPHVLAGFRSSDSDLPGTGIDSVDEITSFATSRGWSIDTIDVVKHMNADQASCGYGCSGNPYDAYWTFDPLGHGDIHELGHGLEKRRFRFNNWNYHASTNPYSYYSKSRLYENGDLRADGNGLPECQSLPFKTYHDVLKTAAGQADPQAYATANLDYAGDWKPGMSFFIQFFMNAQYEGVVEKGWHVLGRLHMLDREYNRADNNETSWLASRHNLGFSRYAFADLGSIDNQDWMVIALSYVTGRDQREFMKMWGLEFSTTASNQVEAFGYPAAGKRYFLSDYYTANPTKTTDNDYCLGLNGPKQTVVNLAP